MKELENIESCEEMSDASVLMGEQNSEKCFSAERKNCKFYVMLCGQANVIDGWIEDGKICSAIHEGYPQIKEMSTNLFFKTDTTGGISTSYCAIAEYVASYGEVPFLFEIDKKWGYGNPWSGKIFVEALYDFAWPFGCNEYAVVCKGGVYQEAECWLYEYSVGVPKWSGGGRCGLINMDGKLVIPFLYDVLQSFVFEEEAMGNEELVFYYLAKRGKLWGMVDAENREKIPFEWDALYLACGANFLVGEKDVPCESDENETANSPTVQIKYTLFSKKIQQILGDLDWEPFYCGRSEDEEKPYYVLQKGDVYGILDGDGELIVPIRFTREEMLERFPQFRGSF